MKIGQFADEFRIEEIISETARLLLPLFRQSRYSPSPLKYVETQGIRAKLFTEDIRLLLVKVLNKQLTELPVLAAKFLLHSLGMETSFIMPILK